MLIDMVCLSVLCLFVFIGITHVAKTLAVASAGGQAAALNHTHTHKATKRTELRETNNNFE